jgi:hypothetical protein
VKGLRMLVKQFPYKAIIDAPWSGFHGFYGTAVGVDNGCVRVDMAGFRHAILWLPSEVREA